jgi:hypothetical protein
MGAMVDANFPALCGRADASGLDASVADAPRAGVIGQFVLVTARLADDVITDSGSIGRLLCGV